MHWYNALSLRQSESLSLHSRHLHGGKREESTATKQRALGGITTEVLQDVEQGATNSAWGPGREGYADPGGKAVPWEGDLCRQPWRFIPPWCELGWLNKCSDLTKGSRPPQRSCGLSRKEPSGASWLALFPCTTFTNITCVVTCLYQILVPTVSCFATLGKSVASLVPLLLRLRLMREKVWVDTAKPLKGPLAQSKNEVTAWFRSLHVSVVCS